MNEIPETEQWLLVGDCSRCRKQSYCRKKCGAVKREFRNGFRKAVAKALEKKMEEKNGDEKHDNVL